jgi:adenylate cyclase
MAKDHTERWARILRGEHPVARIEHALMGMIPSNPRCKMCRAPFGGFGGRLMRMLGRRPWQKNPTVCNVCQNYAEQHPGGAEVEIGFLFADVRGSTSMAERMTPTEFSALLNRFYAVATSVLLDHNAWVDKLVGDEVVAFFMPAMTQGRHHARAALDAAHALLHATGAGTDRGPWIPIGIGVHAGTAYVGTVGTAPVTDITALGDDVNVAARLAAAAPAATIFVSESTCAAAGVAYRDFERRELDLKGKSASVAVRVMSA